MTNVMVALSNVGLALCSTPQSLANAHYLTAVYAAKTWKPLKLAGVPKLPNRSQPPVGRSSPYCGDMWRRYCCLTSFFSIVDTCLSCKDIARQSCAMMPRWRFLATFCVLHFQGAACSTFQTCIWDSQKATSCVEVTDVQSATAEIRRGNKKRRRRKKQDENIYGLPYYIGRP